MVVADEFKHLLAALVGIYNPLYLSANINICRIVNNLCIIYLGFEKNIRFLDDHRKGEFINNNITMMQEQSCMKLTTNGPYLIKLICLCVQISFLSGPKLEPPLG